MSKNYKVLTFIVPFIIILSRKTIAFFNDLDDLFKIPLVQVGCLYLWIILFEIRPNKGIKDIILAPMPQRVKAFPFQVVLIPIVRDGVFVPFQLHV